MLRVVVEHNAAPDEAMQKHGASRQQSVSLITAQGTENCVVCHADTGVSVRESVDKRSNYVAGIGQCCEACSAEW